MPLSTFANGESLASVRTKLNDAIAVADTALQPGDVSGGETTDAVIKTANFNFGADNIVYVDLSSNITGTLPATVTNKRYTVIAKGLIGATANRFTLGLNGNFIGFTGSVTDTSTSFEAGDVSPFITSLRTELGASTSSAPDGLFNNVGTLARTGSRSLQNSPASFTPTLQFTVEAGASCTFSMWARRYTGTVAMPVNIYGGAAGTTLLGTLADLTGSYQQLTVNVPVGTNIMKIVLTNDDGDTAVFDDFAFTNLSAATPSYATNVTALQIGPGSGATVPPGSIVIQGSAVTGAWHVISRTAGF